MVAGRGVAQLITSGQIVTFNSPDLSWFGSGSLLFLPTPVIIAVLTLLLFWLLTRKTALGMFIEPGGESGGGALRADCPVATLYQSD